MKEGHGNADAVFMREAHVLRRELGIINDVDVGEQDAFGLAGGAGGVLHVDRGGGVYIESCAVGFTHEFIPVRCVETDDVAQGEGLTDAGFGEDGAEFGAGITFVQEERFHA